jgi:hypothetical protein
MSGTTRHMVDGMFDPNQPDHEQFQRLMALHKYFLNADFLRDVFMRRLHRKEKPTEVDFVSSMDDVVALSLWYATVYVVIEGWREAQLADPEVDALLADAKTEHLRRFRNQVFHYQREYDNPKLLEFLGHSQADAQAATDWIQRTHTALGRGIEAAVEGLLGNSGASN